MRARIQRWATVGTIACLPLLLAGSCDDEEGVGIFLIVQGITDIVVGILQLTGNGN